MQKSQVIALAYEFTNFTGELNEKGQKVQRDSYPKSHYSGFTSLKNKLLSCIRVTVTEGDQNKEITLDEFRAADPKPQVVSEKFVDSEIELTDKEKKALECAVAVRDEYPAVDEDTVEGFKALCGVDLAGK